LHLGGYIDANDYAEQAVIIPADGILTYWWYMISEEDEEYPDPYDFLSVQLYKTDGTLLTTLKTYSNASERSVWTLEGISLAAYAGQQVIIRFTCATDYMLPTTFWIDNVSIISN